MCELWELVSDEDTSQQGPRSEKLSLKIEEKKFGQRAASIDQKLSQFFKYQ